MPDACAAGGVDIKGKAVEEVTAARYREIRTCRKIETWPGIQCAIVHAGYHEHIRIRKIHRKANA